MKKIRDDRESEKKEDIPEPKWNDSNKKNDSKRTKFNHVEDSIEESIDEYSQDFNSISKS